MIPALDGSSALQWIRYRNVVEIHNGGFLHGTATNITLPISITWQSHVKTMILHNMWQYQRGLKGGWKLAISAT